MLLVGSYGPKLVLLVCDLSDCVFSGGGVLTLAHALSSLNFIRGYASELVMLTGGLTEAVSTVQLAGGVSMGKFHNL